MAPGASQFIGRDAKDDQFWQDLTDVVIVRPRDPRNSRGFMGRRAGQMQMDAISDIRTSAVLWMPV